MKQRADNPGLIFLSICFLAAVAGSLGARPGDALAQSSGFRNVPPGTQMCRDANGKSYLSDKPCVIHYKCYDDHGKLYSTTEPCPVPRQITSEEAARNREAADRRRQESHRRLRDRDPVAWKDLEKQVGGDLSQCSVLELAKSYVATCPSGQNTQPRR